MEIKCIAIGAIGANCYLIKDEESGECAVIDPGRYKQPLIDFLRENQVTRLRYILLTHGHYDHLMGVAELKEAFGGEICIHAEDAVCLTSAAAAMAKYSIARHFIPCEADRLLEDGDILSLGNTVFHILHTPGHTPGGICIYTDGVMFSGDTLFRGTVGRTDFERSDPRAMLQTVRRLAAVKEDYTVYPGHGEPTTLHEEQRTNPFFSV